MPKIEIMHAAMSLDNPNEYFGNASFEVLTSEKAFNHFRGLNPSFDEAIRIHEANSQRATKMPSGAELPSAAFGKEIIEMIGTTMSQPLPPPPSARDIESLFALIQLLSDPKATQARITEFAAAATDARAAIDQAAKDKAAVEQLKATTQTALDQLRQKHQEQIDTERDAHRDQMTRERQEVEALRKHATQDATTAAQVNAEAQELKARLERKLRALDAA